MLRAIVFHGKKQFTAEYYAQEIKNRSYMANQIDGFFKGYGNDLSYALIGDRTIRINSGLFLVQGRQCAVVLGTSEDVNVPAQENTLKGYIIARINTNVLSGDNIEFTYKIGTNDSYPELTQEDTLNIDETTSAIYELPIYSFNIYRTITDVKFLLSPIKNAQIQIDDGTGKPSQYLYVGGVFLKRMEVK